MDLIQVSFLAFIQGFTEFLPISSSAHLILPSLLLGWSDQGLSFDVAVHLGTLLAVLVYFHRDLLRMALAWLHSLAGQHSEDARLAWLLIFATVPAAMAGLLLNDLVENFGRSALVIGVASIVFGIALQHADSIGQGRPVAPATPAKLQRLSWRHALLVGCAQALALIPGTSRSGVTMTAALYCGLSRQDAARFSFLLAIPIIFASGVLRALDAEPDIQIIDWGLLGFAVGLSAIVALACIHYFLRLITRIGFFPFVVYRVLLGVALIMFHFVV
ncbi:MAG: undecaprenyl-diphosphate phosphatase [Pseudohongiellaceae bacterium]